MNVLILAEHDGSNLNDSIYHAITAGLQIGSVDLLIVGYACQQVALEACKISEINKVILADAECYQHSLAENTASLIADIAKNYTHVLAVASTFAKNILPRAAALLDVDMVSDVIEILAPNTYIRPQYAGNVLVTIQNDEPIKVMTIRSNAFSKLQPQMTALSARLEENSTALNNENTKFVKQVLTPRVRPELTSARIVISGGRGLKSADNFHLLEAIADRLGAAIGASRAAVDAGFAPNDFQVGQTGKIVAPDLYIAVGISGAIQHLAGMKDSKIIVAINNDPDAPIVQAADYVLIGDLFKILPELLLELDKYNINLQ
ncbi:MAG TPA: FAD-binding protein [Gammaproteobacteria bacterium]|nr:FAD-binding protein [Gammaproteobacteria bacterium]